MLDPAAGGLRARGIERVPAFFDVYNFAIRIDDESGSIRNAHLRDQDAILFGNLAHMIAQHRVAGSELFLPMRKRRCEIGTDRQYLRIHSFKFRDTRLVRGKFLRSTTGEGGDVEREHDGLLSAKIGEFHLFVLGIGKREIGSFIANFEVSFRRRDLLGGKNRRERSASEQGTEGFHGILPRIGTSARGYHAPLADRK